MPRFELDPLSPNGLSKVLESPGYTPYFKGGPGKPSLVDSVAGKHGAIRLRMDTDLDDVFVSATEPQSPVLGDIWIDIS